MLLDNTKNSTKTLHTEWQSRRCNPMPFLGFIMSVVIGGWPVGHVSTQLGSNSSLILKSNALFTDQSSPFFTDKAATFNSRIKSSKSQHWHLAKATQEESRTVRSDAPLPRLTCCAQSLKAQVGTLKGDFESHWQLQLGFVWSHEDLRFAAVSQSAVFSTYRLKTCRVQCSCVRFTSFRSLRGAHSEDWEVTMLPSAKWQISVELSM